MDLEKLKPLEKRLQIISAIEQGSAFGGEVWQNGQSGREQMQIHLINIKHDKMIVKIFGLMEINPDRPIFIHLRYRSMIFRLNPHEYVALGDKLVCCFPKSAMAIEKRKGDRYVLPVNCGISLSLKKAERTLRQTILDLEVRIVDVSEYGFGIIISGANKDFLSLFDHFWIKSIDHRPLNHFIFGKVTYIAPKGYYLKRGDVRVGLALESPLSRDTLDYLKKKSQLVLTA